jgi:hypothetical protein
MGGLVKAMEDGAIGGKGDLISRKVWREMREIKDLRWRNGG